MRIWLDPVKMAQMGMSTSEVTAALQEQNLQMAAGSVGAPPQQTSQTFEYTVFTNSRLNTAKQFENIIVRSDPAQGNIVYLKDIARVQLGKFSYASNSFVDGKRASYLLVYQAPGSNALETAKGITEKNGRAQKGLP
jgi:HAE1 family hydrophobic/amphiphilic exporter-1